MEEQAGSAEAVVETEQTEQVEESTEQAEETPVEETATEEVEEAPPPKRKQTAQERINELTRIRREKEREAEYWRKVALEKKEPQPEPKQESNLPQRPKLENYESTEQYEDALFEWRDNVREIKSAAERRQKEQETALRDFNSRAAQFRSEHEDFDEVIEAPVFSDAMRDVLLHSEKGPELAYFLGSPENWAEAERIRSLSPMLQAVELGRLETKIQVAKQTKKVPSAPKPITPVGMSGVPETDPSKMTTEEWMEWDKKRTLEKIKARYTGG